MVDGLAAKANPDHQRQDHAPTAAPDPKRDEVAEDNTTTENDETNETPEQEPETGTTEGDTGNVDSGHSVTEEPEGEEVDWKARFEEAQADAEKTKAIARNQEAKYKALARKAGLKANVSDTGKVSVEEVAPKATNDTTDQKEANGETGKPGADATPDTETSDMVRRLAEEVEALKAKAHESEHKSLIAEVANAKGLSVDQARRLQGDTREELEADADEVIALFGLHKTKSPGPAPKPKERRPQRGGATNPDDTDQRSPEDILAAVMNSGRRAKT